MSLLTYVKFDINQQDSGIGMGKTALDQLGVQRVASHPTQQMEITLVINQEMVRQAVLGWADEELLEGWMDSLLGLAAPWSVLSWLTLARITELALFSAGKYADSGKFRAAGDLLLNPRCKVLYVKGSSQPLLLKRHQAITEQVAPCCNLDRLATIQWLKRKTKLVVEKPALLPTLEHLISNWQGFEQGYHESVRERMSRIASSLCMIQALHLPDNRSLKQHLGLVGEQERKIIEAGLCRFDLCKFHELGEDIRQWIGEGTHLLN